MRTKQQEMREIIAEIRRLIADEPKELPLTDGEIAYAISRKLKLDIKGNRIWHVRQKLGIPSGGNRRKAYKEDGEAKTA